MNIKIKRLNDKALLPTRKYLGDAGLDLYPMHNYWIYPVQTVIIPLGIAVEVPEGYFGLIKEKGGVDFQIEAGVLDSNYRGELKIKIRNTERYGGFIKKDKAIAQLIILPYLDLEVEEVEELSETERGKQGGINERI